MSFFKVLGMMFAESDFDSSNQSYILYKQNNMQVDRDYLAKLLNSLNSAMFATFREADIPEAVLDGIMLNDPKALADAMGYLRAAEIPDKERALKANIINWAINTIAITGELGMVSVKNETADGYLPKMQKEKPKGFGQ